MNLYTVETGNFKLDGGAMYGVVPKVIWQKYTPADNNNMCNWAMRCLLIEDGERLILVDTGIGDKQTEKFFSHYYLNGNETLISSLKKLGFEPNDITDVVLTHLHFDHVGGAAIQSSAGHYKPTFGNAKYWSHSEHWDWAVNPNPREKASFLAENILPIQESGQLNFVNEFDHFHKSIEFITVNGHTESQLIPIINYKGQKIAFMADLIPSAGHIKIPYVPSYDTRPLLSMEEKTKFLARAIQENIVLLFEHDAYQECCTVKQTERGVVMDRKFLLSEI